MTSIRQLSEDLPSAETLASDLKNWLKDIDPDTYQQDVLWSSEMKAEHAKYKELDEMHARAIKNSSNYYQATEGQTTAEEHLVRIKLAIEWGEASVKY